MVNLAYAISGSSRSRGPASARTEVSGTGRGTAVDASKSKICRCGTVVSVRSTASPRYSIKAVTSIIGPSGCGKSTFLRWLNRMHELVPADANRRDGSADGKNLYASRSIPRSSAAGLGMVFQKSNPFPTMSIGENVIIGLRLNGVRDREISERTAGEIAADGGAVGRSERRLAQTGHKSVRRPATTALHRRALWRWNRK